MRLSDSSLRPFAHISAIGYEFDNYLPIFLIYWEKIISNDEYLGHTLLTSLSSSEDDHVLNSAFIL